MVIDMNEVLIQPGGEFSRYFMMCTFNFIIWEKIEFLLNAILHIEKYDFILRNKVSNYLNLNK